jgi:4'-phosphopantetheinyl transferase
VDLDRLETPPADLLPKAEYERAQRLRRTGDRRRWVVSRWALREILSRYLKEQPETIQLRFGRRGKPALAKPTRLRFNLSHSDGLALVALTEACEVGIDVESIDRRRDSLRLAELALDEDGAALVRGATPDLRDAVFCQEWTRREATVKCLGSGLAGPTSSAVVTVAELATGTTYAAAIAAARNGMPARLQFELQPSDVVPWR